MDDARHLVRREPALPRRRRPEGGDSGMYPYLRLQVLIRPLDDDRPGDLAARRYELLLGGKVGRLIYGVEAARFLPILKAGEILHVGKNPTSSGT